MDKRNEIYVSIIVVVLFLTSIVTITFAYINRPTVTGNTNVQASIGNVANDLNLTFSGATTLDLNITLDNLSVLNASNAYESYISNSANVTVNLVDNSSMYTSGVNCTYDITYTPINSYTKSSGATTASLNELVISGSNGTSSFNDFSISGLTSKTIVYTSSIQTATAHSSATQTWALTLKFYNLNVDQSSVIGSNPSGTIAIAPKKCEAN